MTAWVLLRGLTREARHWGSFPQSLAAATGGGPVICLDLPGNGKRNRMYSPCRVEAMAEHCHAEVAAIGLGKCNVLAMSLGAMVTVAWAQRYPEDMDAAVLINTSLRPFSPFYRRLKPGNYLRLLRLLATRAGDRELETTIMDATTRLVPDPAPVIEQWLRWRHENPVSRGNALRQLLAAAAYRAPLDPPLKRLLLLAGSGDRLVDCGCSLRLAAQWHVPIMLHPLAGHDLPQDDAPWVLAQVRSWLDGFPHEA